MIYYVKFLAFADIHMKKFNKLVRDRIPEIIAAKGEMAKVRTLKDEDFVNALAAKLVEEAKEVEGAQGDAKELVKEIGDVFEVVDALIVQLGLSCEEIKKLQAERREKRGGFSKKIFLEYVE